MSSILSIGAAGMQAAASRFEDAATRVVRSGAGLGSPEGTAVGSDLAEDMVAMTLASYDFKASVRITEVGRDMMRSTLDMLA